MRVLFFGYTELGADAIDLLRERGDDVLAIVTPRDDPGEERWYRTPAEAARGISVVHDDDPRVPALARQLAPDLILSVMYRSLLSDEVLATARLAALNLHPSLLPAYRGRAPINWVLVNGERETGATLHHMTSRADAGDIVCQRRIEIAPRETALTLFRKVQAASRELLAEALPLVAAGTAPRTPQDHARASRFGRRRPEDGRIDWSWPVHRIDCLVRAVAPPWPGAFGEVREGGVPRSIAVPRAEPAPSRREDAPPGTLVREGDDLFVRAGDGWLRLTP